VLAKRFLGYACLRTQARNDDSVAALGGHLHVEGNFDFLFGSGACFSGRLDAEIRLLGRGFASVMAVFQSELRGDRPCLPAHRETTPKRPTILPGGLDGGVKTIS
jgi:hypothetical protein